MDAVEAIEKIEVPKEYEANLKFRAELLTSCEDNIEMQALVKHRCKTDHQFFFDALLWTFDPRFKPFDFPFITYDYEVLMCDWIDERIDKNRDGFIDKTRDMGVTWTILAKFLHRWIFDDGFLAHLGSKTEDDVDRTGDMKSLFEKLRYMIKKLPKWIVPSHEMRFMRLINHDKGNSITGESANKNWARQGRYKITFYDEFAVTEYADEIWTAAGDSTPSRLVVGTPFGTGNKFWRLRYHDMDENDQLHLHWTLHPRKNIDAYKDAYGKTRSPWYDAECDRRTPIEIAQELDIDYLASGNPYFDLRRVAKQEIWTEGKIADVNKRTYVLGNLSKINTLIRFRPTPNGVIRFFEMPTVMIQATIMADPAEGLAHGDMSTVAVRCKLTGNLLAGVYGKHPPDELAELVWLLSLFYNKALCCAEMGGYGLSVNQFLWDKGANTYRDIDTSQGAKKEGKKLGFNTKRHRNEMLRIADEETRNEAVELRDKRLITEFLNFINKDGKPQASEGSTDDYIIAFCGAGFLAHQRPYSKETERRALGQGKYRRGGEEQKQKPNQGFGFASEGAPPRRF